jgi:hypothetical protein
MGQGLGVEIVVVFLLGALGFHVGERARGRRVVGLEGQNCSKQLIEGVLLCHIELWPDEEVEAWW